MSTEVMRTVSMLVGVGTLSLFSTILAYGAANAATLKWDGSFCTPRNCPATLVAPAPASARVLVQVHQRAKVS
jgi:hypothetical protein